MDLEALKGHFLAFFVLQKILALTAQTIMG